MNQFDIPFIEREKIKWLFEQNKANFFKKQNLNYGKRLVNSE